MPRQYKLLEVNSDTGFHDPYIFNTYPYFELHKTPSSFYFALQNTDAKVISGICHFAQIENNTFISPLRGTFAGLQVLQNDSGILSTFLTLLEETLKQKGARKVAFTSAPSQYDPIFSEQLIETITSAGFVVAKNDPAYIMQAIGTDFFERINRNHQRNLKKCIASGFVFEQVFSEHEMREVYNVIVANRQNKGYNISMTFEQIMHMQSIFSDCIYFFKATLHQIIAASSICIRVNANVLYVFYWGDMSGYEQYSPVTFIADGIYKFAQHHHFKLLDIGGATIHDQPITGLINFKQSLGFTPSDKFTFEKTL